MNHLCGEEWILYHIEQTKTGFAVWNEGDPGIIFMEEPGLFSWIENSEGITITGYKGNYLEIIIPEIIDGKPVTKIGARALSYCKTLKRVKIPESVTAIGVQAFYLSNSLTDISIPSSLTQIGDHAFCHCASLRRVELPDSLKTIGDAAFYNCRSLTEVTIPRSVTEIGTAAFSYCASLEVIAVAQDNPVYRSEGGYLYNSDYTGLIHCPAGKTGTVSIRQGVTCLEWGAFKGCGKLMEIRIPDSVKEISGEAFRDCSSLRNITIPDSVTRIGSNVFEGCSLLTRIVIPRGVVSVDASTFQGCTNLTDIEAVTENPVFVSVDGLLYHKHYSALVCCPPGKTGSVRILSGVERIWSQAFQDCHRITSVEIPYSVTYAWWNSFHYCSSLTEVRASEWFKVHFADCFMGSPWFKSQGWIEAGFFEDSTWILQADDTLRMVCDGDMGDYDAAKILWKGWKKVKDRVRRLTVDDGAESVGSFAFDGFQNLTEAVLPDGLTRIGFRAFSRCRRLKQIIIPDSLTEIGTASFKGCKSLENIVIPESVRVIGHSAFAYCSGLVSVTLTNSEVRIQSNAFKECECLKEIRCIGREENWKEVINVLPRYFGLEIRFIEEES